MRLAANEVERSIRQAQDAGFTDREPRRGPSTDEMAHAFRNADEKKRKPFGVAYLRGRKDGIEREVLTTSFTEDHGPNTYRWVLQRYTDVQELNRRRTTPTYLFRRMKWNARTEEFEVDPTLPWGRRRPPRASLEHSGIDVRPLMPYSHHLLLVREDRLRRQHQD